MQNWVICPEKSQMRNCKYKVSEQPFPKYKTTEHEILIVSYLAHQASLKTKNIACFIKCSNFIVLRNANWLSNKGRKHIHLNPKAK